MNILKQIENILCSQVTPLDNFLNTEPFEPETDYKLEQNSPFSCSLGENKTLNDSEIREAIQNTPDLTEDLEMKQMSQSEFYQLSYMDCLPSQDKEILARTRVIRKLNIGRK